MYSILLTIGLGAIWATYRTSDEIYRLAWIAVSSLALIWGYLASPAPLQMLSLALIFSYLCISHWQTNKS